MARKNKRRRLGGECKRGAGKRRASITRKMCQRIKQQIKRGESA